MGRQPFAIEIGPFNQGGMNTAAAPQLLGAAEATANTAVDYTDGTLKSYFLPGTVVGSPISTTGARYFHYRDGAASPWRVSQYLNFTCLDGSLGQNAYGVSYYTNNTSTPAELLFAAGPNVTDQPLGIASPTISSIANGAGSSPRAYRITAVCVYADIGATFESNPSPVGTTTGVGSPGAILHFTSPPIDSLNVTHYMYIYATLPGTTTGPFYYIGQVASGSFLFTDTGISIGATPTLLNWDVGGSPQGALYVYDHSPAPTAYVVANTLMGTQSSAAVTNGTGTRGGILFAAWGSTLYWSRTRQPWYWPTLNTQVLDDAIEAIVVDRAAAYILTRSGVYVATGSDDASLTITKTQATHGCLPNCGLGAVMTAHGLVYPSGLGIAILDLTAYGTVGNASRVLTQDVLNYGFATVPGGSIAFGAYQDDVYIFGDGVGNVYMMDFSAWPKLRISGGPSEVNVAALAIVHPFSTSNDRGVYALVNNGNGTYSPRPWWPRLGYRLVTPATLAKWNHQTGYIAAGTVNKKKRFIRYWASESDASAVTYTFYCFNMLQTLVASYGPVTASSGWLPSTFTGDALVVQISATTNTDILNSLKIEGEIYA